ncbi:hypothetical protein [Streptomyces cavernicola]|uniref:Ferredoxin n=1 Tax=Streptomyces cavernicola TaxID=3043613 RepID=A0ABT6SBH9_9ACTN|nr:hypothetical protein [Streptomyces sp. B-S-A6]MDI3405550.1 hypothetical protein [Streptomyces sp. B-S-A6]
MSVRSRVFVRRRSLAGASRADVAAEVANAADIAEVWDELVLDLPDEDLAEDPQDCLDFYEPGSKPRCEELEYLQLLRDARDALPEIG